MPAEPSKADPCITLTPRQGHKGDQAAGQTWIGSQPEDHRVGGPMQATHRSHLEAERGEGHPGGNGRVSRRAHHGD
jgi:hypothetical protein